MQGADFLLSMIGLPKEELDALKAMLEPGNLKRVLGDFKSRFDEMEKRNIEMHAAVMSMVPRGELLAIGHSLPGDEVLHAEMDRQTLLFQERIFEHG